MAASMVAVLVPLALVVSAPEFPINRGQSPQAPADKKPTASASPKDVVASKSPVRTDALGEPLPDHALHRLGTLRFRHGGSIHNLLLTADGKTLVSNDFYGTRTVCVWDLATGKLRHRLPGTFDQRNIALSPEGKLVAIGQKKAIFLWDLASGKEVRRLPQAEAAGVAFSPDGKTLAATFDATQIQLWDLANAKVIAKLRDESNTNSAAMLAFTPDGKTLIAGQQFDSRISLWDVASGKKRQDMDAKTGDLFSIDLSPDGGILATGSRQGGIPLWDVKTGRSIRQLRANGGKECSVVAFAPDGKTLAAIQRDAGDGHDFLSLWDVAQGKETRRFKSDIGLWNVVFSRDGKTLIVASVGAIRLLDAATGQEIGPTAGTPGWVGFATLSADGRKLAYLRQHEIRFWDMKAGRDIGSVDVNPHGLQSLALSPDGRTAAAGVGDYTIKLWDVGSRKLLRRLQWDKKENRYAFWVWGIAFSPDGRLLATAEDFKSSSVRLLDAATGREVRRLTLSDPNAPENNFVEPRAVAFSPDGRLLAASGRTGRGGSKVKIWDAATGRELPQLTRAINARVKGDEPQLNDSFEHKLIFPKVVFSPNGNMIAKNGRLKTISIWETATGQQRLLLKGHEESTVCVAFAPDSRTLASASWNSTIRLWDLETGRELRKLTGHRGKANSLAFSADGKILVSSGDDTTILFWDVADITGRKRPAAVLLTQQEWQALWDDLARDDAAKAYAAMVRMAGDAPTTIAALRTRLHPIAPVEPERLARLLKELDSDEFAVRESASRELEKLDDVVEPKVRQTLTRPGLSLEVRRRLEALAASLDMISGARLRSLRAIEVLEMLGTAEAQELLRTIAAGASEARQSQHAKAAMQRLMKRDGN